jgi:hypothetical protein
MREMHYGDWFYRALAECGVYMSAFVYSARLFSTAASNAENGACENKATVRATKNKRFLRMRCTATRKGWGNALKKRDSEGVKPGVITPVI